MNPSDIEQLIVISIIAIAALVFLLLLAVSIRRINRAGHYRRLDLARKRYLEILLPAIKDGLDIPDECYGKKVYSAEWVAIEEIFLDVIREKMAPVSRVTVCLERLGYTDVYIKGLVSGNRFHRALSAEKIGRLRLARATKDLITAVNDPAREVRIVAVRSLGVITSPQAIQTLIDLLVSGAQGQESIPFRVLKTAIEKYKREAVRHLVPLLRHDSWRVRAQAADILGEIGVRMPEEALLSKLDDPEPDVRARISKSLGKSKSRDAVQPLIRKLKDTSWLVRLQAAKAIGLIGGDEAVTPLLELLSDSHWRVRAAATDSLRRAGSNKSIPGLLKALLSTEDRYAREQIVEELQKTDVLEKQIRRLGSRNLKEREAASILLVVAGDCGALSIIAGAVRTESNPAVRMRLAYILGIIKQPRCRDILREVAEGDDNEAVRYAAGMILDDHVHTPASSSGGGESFQH